MSDSDTQRLFTVQEANDLVPELTEIFDALHAEQSLVEAALPDIRNAAERAALGGGSAYGRQYVTGLTRITELVDRVEEMGVIVKDIRTGLCDFLYDRDGELVFLCWRHGEPQVAWWHRLEDGFRGRQNIEELTG